MINGVSGMSSYGVPPVNNISSQPPFMSTASANRMQNQMLSRPAEKTSFFSKVKNYFKNVGKALIGLRDKQPPMIIQQPQPPVAKPANNIQATEPDDMLADWGDFGEEDILNTQVPSNNNQLTQDIQSEAYLDILKKMKKQYDDQQVLLDSVQKRVANGSFDSLDGLQGLIGNSERLEYNERPIF